MIASSRDASLFIYLFSYFTRIIAVGHFTEGRKKKIDKSETYLIFPQKAMLL